MFVSMAPLSFGVRKRAARVGARPSSGTAHSSRSSAGPGRITKATTPRSAPTANVSSAGARTPLVAVGDAAGVAVAAALVVVPGLGLTLVSGVALLARDGVVELVGPAGLPPEHAARTTARSAVRRIIASRYVTTPLLRVSDSELMSYAGASTPDSATVRCLAFGACSSALRRQACARVRREPWHIRCSRRRRRFAARTARPAD